MHVAIVGGGVAGLCAAYALRRRGMAVTLVERGGPAHDSCSLGNAGMITPSHFEPLAAPGMVALGLRYLLDPEGPFALRLRPDPALLRWLVRFARAGTRAHVARCTPILRDLNLRSRALFVDYAERHGNAFGLDTTGLLMLAHSPQTFAHEAAFAERARAAGLPVEVLDREELAALEPDVAFDVAGAVRFPLDAHLAPHRFVAALTEQVAAMGTRFVWHAEATGFRRDGRTLRAITTAQGEIEGDVFVLAAGVFSSRLAQTVGASLPMQAGKGYSLHLDRPRRLPTHCAILVDARVAVTPMLGGLRVGGTMEIGGLDRSVQKRRVEGMKKAFVRYLPDFDVSDFDGVPVWTGLRPCSPDGMPYLGRAAAADNLVVATGHAMMGLSLGPVTGELVADLVTGTPPPLDLSLLDPDRYR